MIESSSSSNFTFHSKPITLGTSGILLCALGTIILLGGILHFIPGTIRALDAINSRWAYGLIGGGLTVVLLGGALMGISIRKFKSESREDRGEAPHEESPSGQAGTGYLANSDSPKLISEEPTTETVSQETEDQDPLSLKAADLTSRAVETVPQQTEDQNSVGLKNGGSTSKTEEIAPQKVEATLPIQEAPVLKYRFSNFYELIIKGKNLKEEEMSEEIQALAVHNHPINPNLSERVLQMPLLFTALIEENQVFLSAALKRQDINVGITWEDSTLFHKVAEKRNYCKQITEELIKKGASPHIKDRCGNSVFLHALKHNNTTCATALLDHFNASIRIQDKGENGNTALHWTVYQIHDPDEACYLIDHFVKLGADIQATNQFGRTPLQELFFRGKNMKEEGFLKIAQKLVQVGATVSDFLPYETVRSYSGPPRPVLDKATPDEYSISLLSLAREFKMTKVIEWLQSMGVSDRAFETDSD